MTVSAIIVTRGDVDLAPVLRSLPLEWELLVWNNSGTLSGFRLSEDPNAAVDLLSRSVSDLSVYGRYAAIEYASNDLIYVQDDDVIVSDPQRIVTYLIDETEVAGECVVCNMPPEFRHEFYKQHALVGFGAAFHRDAPERAFVQFARSQGLRPDVFKHERPRLPNLFDRTCDIVFTGLTPRVLVDVPRENLPYAHGDDRMWRQPGHQAERSYMLEQVLKIKENE